MATYPSKSPASILSSTSAQMRLTTRRSTQRQQVRLHASAGSASALVFLLMKVNCIRCSEPSTCFQVTWFVYFYFYLLSPRHSPAPTCFRFRCSLPSTPGAEEAQLFTLRTATALAMTVVDVVCRPALLQRVREDFRLAKLHAGETSGEER